MATSRWPLKDEGEFDAAAHGVDAFGAYADAVTEVPGEFFGGSAAATAVMRACSTAARRGFAEGDDGVVALAEDAAGAGGLFKGVDGEKAFDENFEELDEAAEFLDRNDQGVVLLAEMVFHELRSFPVHQFAFGTVGAALGFGSF